MIDLELTNQLSYYYLKQNFPSLKIQTFNSENLKKLDYNLLNSVDVIILTPDILIDEKIKIDLFVNSRSFAEMEYKSIQDYFKLIQNNLRDNGFFLNINRYIKRSVGYNIFFIGTHIIYIGKKFSLKKHGSKIKYIFSYSKNQLQEYKFFKYN